MTEQSTLPNAFSKVVTDLADLIQKEMRLARAELAEKLSASIRAGARPGSANGIRMHFPAIYVRQYRTGT